MWYIYILCVCVCVAYCSTENAIGSLHGHEHRRVSVPGRLPLQRPVRPSNIAGLDSRISWASECPAARALWGKDWKDLQGWSWLIMVDQSWSINIDIILISNIFQHYPTLCIYSPFSSKVIPESSSSSVCPSSAAQEKPTCSLQVVSMTCSTTCKLLRTRGSTRNQGISRPATLDLSKVRRPARWCDLSCERLWITGWHLWYPWYPSPGTGPKLWYASLNMTPGLAPFLVAN